VSKDKNLSKVAKLSKDGTFDTFDTFSNVFDVEEIPISSDKITTFIYKIVLLNNKLIK
jgi:hypothetical protein